jgi:hypothetical protein
VAKTAFVKRTGKKLQLVLVLLLVISSGMLVKSLTSARIKQLQETHDFFRSDIESMATTKTPPVLLMEGTVSVQNFDPEIHWDGGKHTFQLVMRGFTNYFLKETWGAERNQHSFLGDQKSGGYKVIIRTKNFAGEWHYELNGTHGSGGGGGYDAYQDDLLPGRWLWNQKGFVGAKANYENHHESSHRAYGITSEVCEEYRDCELVDDYSIPRTIIWRISPWFKASGEPFLREERTFKITSYKFQNEPSEDWFVMQITNYIPDAYFKITNDSPISVLTNQ